jgi:hypothetical protein
MYTEKLSGGPHAVGWDEIAVTPLEVLGLIN